MPPSSFELSIGTENEVFIFTRDLPLFYPFVTKITNSEDLEVIVSHSKCVWVLHVLWSSCKRPRTTSIKASHTASALGLCTPSCFFTALKLSTREFTLDLCARLRALHSANCNTIAHKNSRDSMLPHFNCKSNR